MKKKMKLTLTLTKETLVTLQGGQASLQHPSAVRSCWPFCEAPVSAPCYSNDDYC